MALNKKDIETYLVENKSLVLATVDTNGDPQVRHIGGYGVDGLDIYFSTSRISDKVEQIDAHPEVALLFQHEGQVIPNLKNITIYGKAEKQTGDAFNKALEIIKVRRPQANADEEKSVIYKINASRIKVLDFSKQPPVEEVKAEDVN